MTIKSINPATNEELKRFDELSEGEIQAAVGKAHDAFGSWRAASFKHRKQIVLRVARALRDQVDEFAELITREMGKRISESRAEILFCAEIAEFYANGAEGFLANQVMDVDDADAYIQYAPIGPVLGAMPWSFPFYQVTRFAAPNLMCGNTVLIKHASNVPQCAAAIAALFAECGLPDGVYTNLPIPSELVGSIIEDKHIRGVSLTGSEGAGSKVASQAGKHLKPSVLELGGNDAFIVLEDADLGNAVEMAVKARMANPGQSCVASKRFIVTEAIADEFLAAFKSTMSLLKMGDPMDPETDVAPLSTEGAANDLDEKVRATVDAGATVLLGGDRPKRNGAFYNPTILTGVKPDMPSCDQELFGPVATAYIVKNEAEAISLANDSSYGLGGSVYTRDLERGRRVAEQMETGMVFINQPTDSQAELPFGGTKNSGYGRELSHLGILEFVNKKLIHAMK